VQSLDFPLLLPIAKDFPKGKSKGRHNLFIFLTVFLVNYPFYKSREKNFLSFHNYFYYFIIQQSDIIDHMPDIQ